MSEEDPESYDPPGGEPWVVTVGVDGDGDLVIQAITENVELPDVDALEHRFYAAEAGEGPVAVYAGVMVHACKDEDADHDSEAADCELYTPSGLDGDETTPDGEANLSDLPEFVRERVAETLDLELVEPLDIEDPEDSELGPEELGIAGYGTMPDEREPRGYQ